MPNKESSAVRTVLLAIEKSKATTRTTDGADSGDDDPPVTVTPVAGQAATSQQPQATTPPVSKVQAQAQTPPQGQPTPQPTPPVVDPLSLDYPVKRDAAQLLLTALLAHRQSAHVAGETGIATAALLQGKTHADAAQWPLALAEVEKARKACADGKGFADNFHAFVTGPRRSATDAVAAATAAGIAAGPHQTKLNGADTKAAPATRDYPGATVDVNQIGTAIGTALVNKYIVPMEGRVQAHKTSTVKVFLKPLTDQIDTAIAQQRQMITDKAYGQLRLGEVPLERLMINADKMSPRRKAFEDQRPLTVVELDKVKAIAALALPHAELDKRLKAADQQASYAAQHMDDARRELLAMVVEAKACLGLQVQAVAYSTERQRSATAMDTLNQHKAAVQIEKERNAISVLLAAAVAAAGDTGAAGAVLAIKVDRQQHDLVRAMALLAQVKADQAMATTLAEGLDGVSDAQAAIASANDAGGFDKAIKALKAELAQARKAKHADLATTPFDLADTAIQQCEGHVKTPALELARTALATAGVKLAEGRRLQIEHAQFAEQHKALAAQQTALQKVPDAAKSQLALDALKKALDDADVQDKAGDFVKALALLREADAAASRAKAAISWRKTFDEREAAQRLALNDANYAAIKVAQLGQADAAKAHADKLAFDAATKTLDGIDSAMAKADVLRLAAATPNAAELLTRAQELKKKGGPTALDELIAALPNSTSKEVFTKLAQERFGVEVMSTDASSANTAAALKQMCKLFATIPEMVMDNPSLKKVEHTATGGASYTSSGSLVKMNDRPAPNTKADFVKDSSGNPPSGRLPADREELCKPANDNPEDLFDFNSIHEVAHAIDDANNFMASRLGASNTEFAGWVVHGADVKPIGDAVAAKFGYDANDEQKRYVLDKIVGNPIVVPLDGTGAEPLAWKTARDKIDAWHVNATNKSVWSSESKSMAIDISGRIYQESYVGRWMSYQTAARKRGITGYQFRAPGEWFSELYAAFKLKKLKDGHPSESWLSKLSV